MTGEITKGISDGDFYVKSDKQPNIVWIVLDHVTFRHYKMTRGARPVLNTYERLASLGTEFINCHSVHPLCMPARASMLTGTYAHKHGKKRNGRNQPDAGYPLISEILCEKGYNLAYFGKNHSGYEDLSRFGFEGFYPEGYGNPYKTREYGNYLVNNNLGVPIFVQEWGIKTDSRAYENREYDLTKSDNFNTYSAGHFKTDEPVHESDFLVNLACEWLDEHLQDDKPFMLRMDTWGPHHSFQVPFSYKDLINPDEIEEYPSFGDDAGSKPEFVRSFLAGIKERNPLKTWKDWQPVIKRAYENYSYIDMAIGKVIDKLKDKGLLDNTYIIYTADHGDALGSHGGMVDKAGDMMEELMHIPLVITGPGIKAGAKSDAHVSNLDITATILELVGMTPPSYMDGQSLTCLLEGDGSKWREDFMAEHYGHFNVHKVQRALYYKNYKYIATEEDLHELYDLEKDPFETDNLVNRSDMKDVADVMRKRLMDYMERHGDTEGRELLGLS
ncbi:MAG TPA: sulfatase-like hydrolase/transferase [Clostridiaceae bacterium]|nr:sulfatase-like hydrolase/transferase [Clostridiaceae bacterium]